MTKDELLEKLNEIQKLRCETQNLELKAAHEGAPGKLYSTLSSFSNQDDGGIIIFGVDEKKDYEEIGVYDAQDLQKKIMEQCQQMIPPVRPLITVGMKDEKLFLAAEVPGMDIAERPCYYKGKGRISGSYIRTGDGDLQMSEYEIYSYEAFRKHTNDDIRVIPEISFALLDDSLLEEYLTKVKYGRPNLNGQSDEKICELMSVTKNGEITLNAALLFCPYPQAFFPQLCITAVAIPGEEMGTLSDEGERFLDNQRIEGNIKEMVMQAIQFVKRNMKTSTIINHKTGGRTDREEYPVVAVREAVVNALVHRDYSVYTENIPIQINMYQNRLEIISPGGLYGRIKVDELGEIRPDTRNPFLATKMEMLKITENRYSGIPTIRKAMEANNAEPPRFENKRDRFIVTLFGDEKSSAGSDKKNPDEKRKIPGGFSKDENKILDFCEMPRSRKDLAEFLGISSVGYAMRRYIQPLIDNDLLRLTIPDKPRSSKQRYYRSPWKSR